MGGFEGGVAWQSELGDLEVDPRDAARARCVPPHARRRADLAHDLKVLARRLLVDDAAGARLRPVGARFDREEAAHLRVVGEQSGLTKRPLRIGRALAHRRRGVIELRLLSQQSLDLLGLVVALRLRQTQLELVGRISEL